MEAAVILNCEEETSPPQRGRKAEVLDPPLPSSALVIWSVCLVFSAPQSLRGLKGT